MASYVYPTPEVYKSVTRPVAMQIIRNMFTITGIDPKVFRSKMIGMVESEKVPGSAIDDKAPNDEQLQNRLSSDKKFSMEIEEEFLGDLVTAVKRPNNHPVFYDPALKLSIKPVRLQVKTKISVIVNFMDKVSANNWLRQIKAQILQTGLTHYHTIDYHYPLPRNIVAQLMHMHKLRENVDGYGESFGQWCRRCFVKTYDIITNGAGQGKQFVIREKQTNIYGWFDFDFVPTKAEKESDRAGGWNIQFDYYFYYDRPDNLVISFPLMVHNQLISQEYFNPERPLNRDSYRSFSSMTDEAYDRIVATVNKHSYTRRPGIPAPIFDDWNCGEDPKGFVQFSRTLLSLDPNDKKWLVNLDELSTDYSLKPIILNFINKSGNSVFKKYDSIFNIVLYRWDSLLGPEHLNLVKPNKIVTPLDLSLRDMYHIVIYLLIDISMLSDKGWDDLLNDCKVFHEYADMLFPGTGVEKIRCNSDNTVNRDDFDDWWNNIKDDSSDFTNPGGGPGNGGPGGYNPYDPQWGKNNDYKTIGFFGIQAKRKGEVIMPLVTYGNMPVPNESNKDYAPQLSDVLYKHSIISSTRQPVDALLTQISGSSWTVDYYSQVLASDEELSTYDPVQSQAYQQYLLIKRYELKLQGELNKNIDPQDQTAIITGTAIMYPYMKPNVGDAFIADVGDGQAALFTVTNTQKLSMFKKACYEIEFAIRMYVTKEVFDNISSKVVKETEFVKDFMTYGQNPVIATEDKLKKDKLEDAINDSLADWLTNFYSNEYRTILVPTLSKVTYDPFITTFITELFDTNRHPLLKQIDLLNADDNEINLIIDIWEALMQREVYMLRTAFQEYTLLAPTKLTYNPFMQTAYWSGITAILNPKRHTLLTDARLGIITADSTDKYSEPGDVAYVPNAGTMPTYVFSESFYNGDMVAMSSLERMTYNYLTYKANNWKDILALFIEKDKWSLMQKFYYTPIIWVLAIAELRGI